jgi:TetR/AcrR family transcriptional repressor of nem operon
VCLCGVLGAEIGGLPADVGAGTRIFFEKNLEWLKFALAASGGLSEAKALSRATLMLAALEGALILSKSLGNDVVFERIGEGLLKMVLD